MNAITSDPGATLDAEADYAQQAVVQDGGAFLEQQISKNVPTAVKVIVGDLETLGKDAGTGAAIGAIAGSWFPVVGTAIGGAIGTAVGVVVGAVDDIVGLFGRKSGPPDYFDDAAWDNETGDASEGRETLAQGFKSPNSYQISGTQLALVRHIALIITSLGPGWKAQWPTLWRQIAVKNAGVLPNGHWTTFYRMIVRASGSPKGVNSPLLANSVARFLGAPQNGAPFPVGALMNNPINPSTGLPYPNGYVPPPPAHPPGWVAPPSALKPAPPSNINPKTGLPYPNPVSTVVPPGQVLNTPGQGWGGPINLSGFGAYGGGLGMFGFDPTKPINVRPISSVVSPPITIAPLGSLAPGGSLDPNASAHQVVASAAAGDPNAQTGILNAVSSARSPNATPQQQALADTLALAHKIQTHAKYVQKWKGPAAAQQILTAHYLTIANLGN
jgi:hypothetical protein